MSHPYGKDDAARWLGEAGERLNATLQLVRTDAGAWSVKFKDGGSFRIEWSDAWSQLVLTAVLGVPAAQGEREALNLALSYNALWREVGKLRMARDGLHGALLLIGELDPERSEAQALDAALLHFEGLRRCWGGMLIHTSLQTPEESPPPNALLGCV